MQIQVTPLFFGLLCLMPSVALGADPTTIEIGGFTNGVPDPAVEPGESNPGYIRITTQPGYWIYPMFHVRLGPATSGQGVIDRNAFISNWPFLEDLVPTQLSVVYADYIDPNNDGIPDIDVVGLPNLEVDQRTLETAFGFAVVPPIDTAVISRMQPVVPLSESSPDANGNWTLDWSTEPGVWAPFPSAPARIVWEEYRSRGCDNDGSNCIDSVLAINFDEILHETIRQQVSYYYPNKTVEEVRDLTAAFMGAPYKRAAERWSIELVVQIIGVKGNVTSTATKADIEAQGIKDIQAGILPDITLSPSDEVVFHLGQLGPTGIPDFAPPENTSNAPIMTALNSKAVFNICSGTAFTRVYWVDAGGNIYSQMLKYSKPGHWSFDIPPTATKGMARIIQFVHPSGQPYPLLTNPIHFLIL